MSDYLEPHESSLLSWHVESHRLFFTNVVCFIAVLTKKKKKRDSPVVLQPQISAMAFVELLTQWFLRLKKATLNMLTCTFSRDIETNF